MTYMRRREFITIVGGAAAAWPLAARAQQRAVPVIGYLGNFSGAPLIPKNLAAFRKGLGETGFIDGQNVVIEYHWMEGQNNLMAASINDMVGRRVTVIAALSTTPSVLAAKTATQSIPIVFRVGTDPVANGIVASLNRPGGNVTGITTLATELTQKRLQLLRELLPAGTEVAVLIDPMGADPAAATKEIQAAAELLGVRLIILNASTPTEIDAAFATIAQRDVRGLFVSNDNFFFSRINQIVARVARRAIPAVYSDRAFYEAGGLMSYGTDIPDGFRLAGTYVGRIIKGEKPADLPVQRSTKVELAVNLKTAKALGIDVPTALLVRANEVIE